MTAALGRAQRPQWSSWMLGMILLVWAVPARATPERVRVTYAVAHEQEQSLRETLEVALDLPELERELKQVSSIDPRQLLASDSEVSPPLARIWLDLTHSGRALVYVIDRSWSRIYIRVVPRVANPAIEHAQVGEIVRSAVQALADGAVIGIARADAERSLTSGTTVAAPVPSKPSARSFGAGVLYGLGLRASPQRVAHGPGLYGYGMAGGSHVSWGAMLVGRYQPLRISRGDAAACLHTTFAQLGPMLEVAVGARLAVRAVIAGGLEIVRLKPEAEGETLDAGRSRWLAFPSLHTGIGFRFRSRGHLELAVALAVDVDVADTRYVLRNGKGNVTVDDPWLVRPSLLTSLGFF